MHKINAIEIIRRVGGVDNDCTRGNNLTIYYPEENEYFINFDRVDGFYLEKNRYYVNEFGLIYDKIRNKILLLRINNKKYYRASLLIRGGGHRLFSIHRIVANVFIEYQPFSNDNNTVDHITPTNGCIFDNHYKNLEFRTRSYNSRKSYKNVGEFKTEDDMRLVYDCLVNKGMRSPTNILKFLNWDITDINRQFVCDIKYYKRYKSYLDTFGGGLPIIDEDYCIAGENSPNAIYNNKMVERICLCAQAGIYTPGEICDNEKWKMTSAIKNFIFKVLNRESWVNISKNYDLSGYDRYKSDLQKRKEYISKLKSLTSDAISQNITSIKDVAAFIGYDLGPTRSKQNRLLEGIISRELKKLSDKY